MVGKHRHSLAQEMLDLLQERGYRDTAPRRALTQVIAGKGRHFGAEELCEDLPNLGRATIYRSLKLLVETGAICRVMLEDGNLHYQVSHGGHHHHLVCVECGASQDLVGCDVDEMVKEAVEAHKFKLSGHWLEVYGRCGRCLSA